MYLLGMLFTTGYLYSFNRYGYSDISGVTIFPSYGNDWFNNGSLILSKKGQVNQGDRVIFYNSYNASYEILVDKVISYEVTNEFENTYLLGSGKYLSSSYIIGTDETSIQIPLLGFLFSFFSSKLAYLIIYVIPIFGFFAYQVWEILKSLKTRGE